MDRPDLDRWKPRDVARLLALVETERRYYQEIVASLPAGLVIVSPELWILSTNRAFRAAFGVGTDNISRHKLSEVVLVEDLGIHVQEVLNSSRSRENVLYSPPGSDPPKFYRVSILPLRSFDDETQLEALLMFEDITSLHPDKSAPVDVPGPEAVRPMLVASRTSSTARSKDPEELPAAIWHADSLLRFTWLNTYAQDLFGHPAEYWLGNAESWIERVYPDDRTWVSTTLKEAVRSTSEVHLEYRCQSFDGRVFRLREAIRVHRNETGEIRGFSGVSFDVSEDRRLAVAQAEDAKMEALSRLSARVAHDCNNLLMIVSGYGESIKQAAPPESTIAGDLEEIMRATERISALASHLASFSRRTVAAPSRFDLNASVASALDVTKRGEEVTEFVRILHARPLFVQADPAQVEGAIAALIAQARTAMPGGVITIETAEKEPTLRLPLNGTTKALLSIRFSDHFLDSDTLARIFELPASTRQNSTSFSNIYWLVRQNGGGLSVASEPGMGTTFSMSFPLAATPAIPQEEESPVTEGEAAADSVQPPAPQARARVMVVEDEEGIRALIGKILIRHGFDVVEAETAGEAIAVAGKLRVDLLICDIDLPDMTGRELAEKLVSAHPDLRVLYASGYTQYAAIASGALPEGAAYLQKPFTLGVLLDKVGEVLA